MGTDILPAVLDDARKKIVKFRDRGMGEQNTKASLIEPVLEALGWDIRDPDEVHREFRANSKDSPVDYALKLLRKPQLFLEAKGLGEDLSDRKWIAQVLGYATVAGVEWCVLTDGDRYRFFNATAAVDAEEKLFREARISEDDPNETAGTLSLISRRNLEDKQLDVLWENHFSDRRVKIALQAILTGEHPGLIRLLRKSIPALKPKQISDSLARLDVSINLMEIDLPQPPARSGQKDPSSTANAGGPPTQCETAHDDRAKKASAEIKALYDELHRFVLGLGQDITENHRKWYIGYERKGSFFSCQIQPRSQRICCWLALNPPSVKADPGFARDVSEIGHAGPGNLEVAVSSRDDLEKAKPLIAQSYRESQ